jgi:hypothetical protein
MDLPARAYPAFHAQQQAQGEGKSGDPFQHIFTTGWLGVVISY